MNEREQEQQYIIIENLSYQYSGADEPALSGISTRFEAGIYYAVLGRNGSGKSTLAGCINSLFIPTGGKVSCCGFDTSLPDNSYEILRRIATVFQDPQIQMVGATVEDEIAFGPENLGLDTVSIRNRVDNAMEMTGIAGIALEQPQKLSMGQKQLVSIAGAIAMEPAFIISDESTSMLDDAARSNVLDIFEKLKQQGIGIIHVTHFLEEAINADEVIILNKGNIASKGSPEEILTRPSSILEAGLEPLPVTLITEEIERSGKYDIEKILTVEELLFWLKH